MNHRTPLIYLTCWTTHQCPTRNNLTHHAPRTTYPALTHHAPRITPSSHEPTPWLRIHHHRGRCDRLRRGARARESRQDRHTVDRARRWCRASHDGARRGVVRPGARDG